MNRHEEEDLLSAYMDGELPAADHARMETHVAVCPSCGIALEGLRAVKGRLGAVRRIPLPASVLAQVERRISRALLRRRIAQWSGKPFVWIPALAAAAAAAFFLFMPTRQPAPIPWEALSAAHERYAAESLLPSGDFSQSQYAAQLTSYEEE
jgi:anti-sigma factor RsiW